MYTAPIKAISYLLCGYILFLAMDAVIPGIIADPLGVTAYTSSVEFEGRLRKTGLMVADEVFGGSDAQAAEKRRFEYPPDETLLRYLDQAIEETLRPTGVVYVNALNFKKEVLLSDRPVMVLFYSQDGSLAKGSAAFARVLHSNLPEIKVAAYVLPPAKTLSVDSFQVYSERYGLKGVPTTLIYDHDKNGNMETQGKVNGGYEYLEDLKYNMEKLFPVIEKDIMD